MTNHSPALLLAVTLISTPVFADNLTVELAEIGVEDGDTLIADIDGVSERLQLPLIDSPEDEDNAKLQHDIKRTGLAPAALLALGSAATAHLISLTADGGPFLVVCDLNDRDRYGRITAEISDKNSRSLASAMLTDGYAKVLIPRQPEAPPPSQLMALEAEAIAASRGIWGADTVTARAWHGGLPQ